MRDSSPEEDWFRVYIDADAEMIAPGTTENDTISRVIGYCNANRFLGLDPEMMLPHGVWGKPLEPIEAGVYSEIQRKTGVTSIRLEQDKRSLPESTPRTRGQEIVINEDQLCLFTISKYIGINDRDMTYSYYTE